MVDRIAPGDWVSVGEQARVEAVICTLRPKRIEVVYLDEMNKAVHREVAWAAGGWRFAKQSQAKYADKDQRLGSYVKILRAGNKKSPEKKN